MKGIPDFSVPKNARVIAARAPKLLRSELRLAKDGEKYLLHVVRVFDDGSERLGGAKALKLTRDELAALRDVLSEALSDE